MDLSGVPLTAVPGRVVTLVPFDPEHLAATDLDCADAERMVPPGPPEAVVVSVFFDRDHEALAVEAVVPGGEFGLARDRLGQGEVEPTVRPDTVLSDPLTPNCAYASSSY
ncbi:hypothetical protein [Streptomyces erythrochromogenes]|uniref:hypothetical protein n=1 Tax=Streptomyces erythrochromogenes TaxID=285574 RepID=UPI0033E65D82